ncbi:hypothetical protein NL676_022257 [Syzygium grande]|nr:hypothetical protein NL676_022257 [Syzygium grande]
MKGSTRENDRLNRRAVFSQTDTFARTAELEDDRKVGLPGPRRGLGVWAGEEEEVRKTPFSLSLKPIKSLAQKARFSKLGRDQPVAEDDDDADRSSTRLLGS